MSLDGSLLYVWVTPNIEVYSLPDLTFVTNITPPTLTSGLKGCRGMVGGAGGKLYFAAGEAFAGGSPTYRYDAAVWSWNGTSWTQEWRDTYQSNTEPPHNTVEELSTNGIAWDHFTNDVYFATFARRSSDGNKVHTFRIRKLLAGTVAYSLVGSGSPWVAPDHAAGFGPLHLVFNPDDGACWVVTGTSTYRIRRWASGFGSYAAVDYEPYFDGSTSSPTRGVPVYDTAGHMIFYARSGGTGSYENHMFDTSGTVVDTVTCSGASALFSQAVATGKTSIITTGYTGGGPAEVWEWVPGGGVVPFGPFLGRIVVGG